MLLGRSIWFARLIWLSLSHNSVFDETLKKGAGSPGSARKASFVGSDFCSLKVVEIELNGFEISDFKFGILCGAVAQLVER